VLLPDPSVRVPDYMRCRGARLGAVTLRGGTRGRRGTFVGSGNPSAIGTGRVAEAGRVQAWSVGSGLGTDSSTGELTAVRAVLAAPVPVVLDADA